MLYGCTCCVLHLNARSARPDRPTRFSIERITRPVATLRDIVSSNHINKWNRETSTIVEQIVHQNFPESLTINSGPVSMYKIASSASHLEQLESSRNCKAESRLFTTIGSNSEAAFIKGTACSLVYAWRAKSKRSIRERCFDFSKFLRNPYRGIAES
ncbi:hypothetical protein EVAR_11153_1 [Eumeta japonica]|uniref:Uncharacterized protein n=1 Tax=Eumeta variegata TaxID=151549 RepID=A0A4C1U472_EUMVA|nr:hypothetical protein EVAR_11153_1 [Eumeta japonica]